MKILKIIGKVFLVLLALLVLAYVNYAAWFFWVQNFSISSEYASDIETLLKREPKVIQKALDGDRDSLRRLSHFYLMGRGGCLKNHIKAKKWAQMAVNNGVSDSIGVLGYVYYMGWEKEPTHLKNYNWVMNFPYKILFFFRGAPDHQKAFNLFSDATQYNSRPREFDVMLGLMFKKGQFVDKNADQAIEFFERSETDCGYIMAGNIYWEGDGIEKRPDSAFENWKKAIECNEYFHQCKGMPLSFEDEVKKFEHNLKQASDEGYEEAALIIAQKAIKEKKLTADIIESLEKLAEKDSGEAQFIAGDAYYRGVNVEKDMEKAFKYFKMSYENKDPHFCANTALANMYYKGLGVKKDTKKAKKLWDVGDQCQGREDYPDYNLYSVEAFKNELEFLTEQNDAEVLYQQATTCCKHSVSKYDDLLGIAYYDYKGKFWFLKAAAESGHREAQYELGEMYYDDYNLCPGYSIPDIDGTGGGIDKDKGFEWFLAAAKQGHVKAMYRVADAYMLMSSKNNYKEAEKWFLKAARSGHKFSASELAKMYTNGLGVEPDYTKATYWAKQAIKLGFVDANYYLGKMYYEGKGVKQDYQKAFAYLSKATDGYSEGEQAEELLSEMYFYGIGTARDEKKAKELENAYCFDCKPTRFYNDKDYKKASYEKLWRAATENNDYKAQIALGKRHEFGEAGDIDLKKAIEWYSRASTHAQADSYAKERMEELKKLIPNDYSEEWYSAVFENDAKAQLALGKEEWKKAKEQYEKDYRAENPHALPAFEWISRAAYSGDAESQYEFASAYDDWVVFDNLEHYSITRLPKERNWLLASAEQGYAKAQLALGNQYYQAVFFDDSGMGKGWRWHDIYVPRDYKKAFKWYKKAADQGNSAAQVNLGIMYANGEYVKKNFSKAKDLYDLAYESGLKEGKLKKAELYLDKDFKEYNPQRAVELYKELVDENSLDAVMALGKMYHEGKFVKKDLMEARKWYAVGKCVGNYDAGRKLAEIYEDKDFSEYNPELAEKIRNRTEDEYFKNLLKSFGIDEKKIEAYSK